MWSNFIVNSVVTSHFNQMTTDMATNAGSGMYDTVEHEFPLLESGYVVTCTSNLQKCPYVTFNVESKGHRSTTD